MRVRVRFTKHGKVRFTSHRDVARMWERAFRRAELPLAYTEGFSPRPKVSFGLALPTGYESDAEYLDVDLVGEVDAAGFPARISPLLPVGVEAVAAAEVQPGAVSLQQDVTLCRWEVAVAGLEPDAAAGQLEEVLARPELVTTRSRKGVPVTEDIRPAIRAVAVVGPAAGGAGVVLAAELDVHPRSVRPGELVEAAWPGREVLGARRTHQWIERDGARREPLEVPDGATDATHVERRAS